MRAREALQRPAREHGVLAQPLALSLPGFPSLPVGALGLIVGRAGRFEHVEQPYGLGAVEYRQAGLSQQAVRLKRERARACDERATTVASPSVLGERAFQRVPEPQSADLRGCQEEQRGEEQVLLAPVTGGGIGGVEAGLLPQACLGHRAEVQLDERGQLALVLVDEDHQRVRCERAPAAGVLERLAGGGLAAVVEQREPRGRRVERDRDVQLGEGGGVREKQRVGLAALTASGKRVAVHHAVGSTRGPVVVGRRAAFAVGPRATHQAEIVQAARAVAQRALADIGQQPRQLVLANHAVAAKDIQQATVGFAERHAAEIGTTTSPDDTISAAGTTG